MPEISERDFESTIVSALTRQLAAVELKDLAGQEGPGGFYTPGGYRTRQPSDYERALCLIPEDVLAFVQSTQPQMWAKYCKQYPSDPRGNFVHNLSRQVNRRGTLDILRKGFKDRGAKFDLYYPRPASGMNPDYTTLYQGNIFSVVRQLQYSQKNNNSLDMVLFLNGLPLFTAELKDTLTRQNVSHAMRQYRRTRDAKEPLFHFKRCLAHFAVDPEQVYFTTRLEDEKTLFLPFNRGTQHGAGNPPSYFGFPSAYLWEQVWAPDSVLNLLEQFVHIIATTDKDGRKQEFMIFPRYHQLGAVRRLVSHAQRHGPGKSYLIQHSAGSGKSYSISWLAHQLAILHDDEDKRVFDTVIVVSDRRVLDQQLQTHVLNFQLTKGIVENIEQTSRQLKAALEDGKNIIVSTLQKFPVILGQIEALKGNRFAVIIDEAHSSQTGEAAAKMNAVLEAGSLEEAEEQEAEATETVEDRILELMRSRGRAQNVSYFAFTATPKPQTLEMFGEKREDGRFEAFSLYPMRQAIEEGFILDVLQNYTTYNTYWKLLKTIEDDPRFDRKKASRLLRSFVDSHQLTIEKKTAIMVEHYAAQVMKHIGGRARAMIVTRSRLHAVRYKLAVDQYIAEKGYPFKALVAFSGTVNDPEDGAQYKETTMNSRTAGEQVSEKGLPEVYGRDPYRILIVAEKFQTGFDQPLLHTMYVDKRLQGLHAVQTLSRLNRIHPQKESVFVLDFVNDPEEIQRAFQPYYEKTLLEKETDPNLLYEFENKLLGFHLFEPDDLEQFAELYFNPSTRQEQLITLFGDVLAAYRELDKDDRRDVRQTLRDFVRVYAFLAQILTFEDADLEKLYVYARLLSRQLPAEKDELPQEVLEAVDLESLRIDEISSGAIELERSNSKLEPKIHPGEVLPEINELELLSKIIADLNDQFGTTFKSEDAVEAIKVLESRFDVSEALKNSVRINTTENARLTFDHVFNDYFQDLIESYFSFYRQVNDDETVSKTLKDILFERYRERLGEGEEE